MQGLFCLTEILKGNNNYVFLTDTLTSNFGEKQKFQFSIKSTTLVCQLNKIIFYIQVEYLVIPVQTLG